MKMLSLKAFPWTAAALALGMPFAMHSAMAAEPSSTMQSSQQTPPPGLWPGDVGPRHDVQLDAGATPTALAADAPVRLWSGDDGLRHDVQLDPGAAPAVLE